MAKKKEKKETTKKGFQYSNEIIGLLVILISIIGIGSYGPAGEFVRSFAVFLVGTIYIVLLIVALIVGCYLIVKREMPNFFTTRLLGFYIIILALLVFLHTKYVIINETEGVKILTETFDNLLLAFKNPEAIANLGGGMIGGIFAFVFVNLFREGTYIVVFTMVILGIILLFNVSLFVTSS